MVKKRSALARRAWRLLIHRALMWMRKGGVLRHRLAVGLRRLLTSSEHSGSIHHIRERELSFDDTPTFDFMRHKSHNPFVQFEENNDSRDDNIEGDDGLEGEEPIDSMAEEFIARFYDQIMNDPPMNQNKS